MMKQFQETYKFYLKQSAYLDFVFLRNLPAIICLLLLAQTFAVAQTKTTQSTVKDSAFEAWLFDEYGNIRTGDEQARLDNFVLQLQNEPSSQGFIVAYGRSTVDINRRLNRIKGYLFTRGTDMGRIVIVDAGIWTQTLIRLYIVPPGHTAPDIENPPTQQQLTREQRVTKRIADDVYLGAADLRDNNNSASLKTSLTEFEKAKALYTQVQSSAGEAVSLTAIAKVKRDLGEYTQALDNYNQALLKWRVAGDKRGEAVTLNNICMVQLNDVGDWGKAAGCMEQLLSVVRQTADKKTEISTLTTIAHIYLRFDNYTKAWTYLVRAQSLTVEVTEYNKAYLLQVFGQAYFQKGEYKQALDFYQRALEAYHEEKNQSAELGMLRQLSRLYVNIGDIAKMLYYGEQVKKAGNTLNSSPVEKAYQLNYLAFYYEATGEQQKAIDLYLEAARSAEESASVSIIAVTLSDLMRALVRYDKPILAIMYGKRAVNTYQQIRANIKNLDQETQHTFLRSIEGDYRQLADILISKGRLPEAQAVLDLLKEEEFSTLVRRSGESSLTVPYSKAEAKAIEIINKLANIGREYNELIDKQDKGLIDEAGKVRLKQLAEDMRVANEAYQKSIAELQNETKDNKSLDTVDTDAQALMEDLRELGSGTVALYTVIIRDVKDKTTNGWIILTTPDFRKAYPIDVTNLEETVFTFRAALSSPVYDPEPLAQQLYKMLFLQTGSTNTTLAADLETYLKEKPNKTLMWSLDGVLRYVPIAALNDGKQYLIERYRNVIFNTASKARLKDEVKRNWTALGLGVSEKREEAGLTFPALPGSGKELKKIIKEKDSQTGILPGVVKANKDFTLESMRDGLQFGNNSVVHISSHFSFQSADFEQSFLLLGKGHWTVGEMRKETNLFRKADLVTLSACETAMGTSNGKDAEGFAYLAQSLGAKAVIASLWPVDDIGTQVLMPEFYRLHETGVSKVEALQKAQLSLLKGEIKETPADVTKGSELLDQVTNKFKLMPFKKDNAKPFAHPYYWAPFILIGNWK